MCPKNTFFPCSHVKNRLICHPIAAHASLPFPCVRPSQLPDGYTPLHGGSDVALHEKSRREELAVRAALAYAAQQTP